MADGGPSDMITSDLETDLTGSGQEPRRRESRRLEQPSPISHLLAQSLLDEAVRALQEDLAMLQAEQERGLSSLDGALEHIGQELDAVRSQLTALAEPLLAARSGIGPGEPGADPHHVGERAETLAHFERLDRQVALLVRGMDTVDRLRHQSDVHTGALARLTVLVGELARPRPVEGLQNLQQAVTALEQAVAALRQDHARLDQNRVRAAGLQRITFALLGLAATPGLAALVWLTLQRGL
jgi:uncharacterized coiled-coil protein SlyX